MGFIRNKETGLLELWEDGRKVGEVITMEDMMGLENKAKENKEGQKNGRQTESD